MAAPDDLFFMRRALELAREAAAGGDTPVGAVLVFEDKVIGRGREAVRSRGDITAHAEVEAVRHAAARAGAPEWPACTLYTTTEPCYMCSFVIRQAGVGRVVIGRPYPAAGGVTSPHPILTDANLNAWKPAPQVVQGVLLEECEALFR